MTRTRTRTGAAGAAVAALLILVFAPPAGASDAPSIFIDSPGEGAVLTGPTATISGRASMHTVGGLETNRVTRVTVSLSSSTHPGPLPRCHQCAGGQGFSVPFSWTTPALAYNGVYQATVVAWGIETVDIDGEQSSSAIRSFKVAVAPAAPGKVEHTVNPDRTVTLSWPPNAEPDLVGFRVQRKDPGGDAFVDAADRPVSQSASGSPSLHDAVPAQGGGGTYVYRVQAIRAGPDGPLASAFAVKSVDVPTPTGAPAPPGGTPAAGGGGGPAGAAAPGAPPDLAGFLSRGRGGGPAAVSPGLPVLPAADTGFDLTLPYPDGLRRGSRAASAILGAAGLSSKGRALAVPLAGGLILVMTSFHLRLLNRRVTSAGAPGTSLGAGNE